MKLIELLQQVKEDIGKEMEIGYFFSHPNIKSLAQALQLEEKDKVHTVGPDVINLE